MNEAQIADAVRRLETAVMQDQCSDGWHDFTVSTFDGKRRCRCGKVHEDDLDE